MTDSQKLEEIIKTAIERGWDCPIGCKFVKYHSEFSDYIDFTSTYQKLYSEHLFAVLFNHDFAKAYFGEELLNDKTLYFDEGAETKSENNYSTAWAYHLQQCVLAENPISYYYDNK